LGGLRLTQKYYLLDTHAVMFWNLKEEMSMKFVQFLDEQDKLGHLLISSISFWEIAFIGQERQSST
jgi:PIN domain nuclease of toxin-antitoxin system